LYYICQWNEKITHFAEPATGGFRQLIVKAIADGYINVKIPT
jgi:hypothetical protein